MLGDDYSYGLGGHDSSAEYLHASPSGDIYVVGHEQNAQGISVPTLWKVSASGSVEAIRLEDGIISGLGFVR
jgi:hypothetical protein